MAEPVLKARGLSKSYPSGAGEVRVLCGVDLDVQAGEFTALLGVSGSGKTTLLHCLGLIESPDAGEISLEGSPTGKATERQRARWRNGRIGFVFQAFHLVPELTALENVLLPAMIRGGAPERERALSLLERVGVAHRAAHRPSQLSGGERQRVAVARALVNRPAVLLADEPTGNLDSETGLGIIRLLEGTAEEGAAVVVVTHNEDLSRRARRVVRMADGRIRA